MERFSGNPTLVADESLDGDDLSPERNPPSRPGRQGSRPDVFGHDVFGHDVFGHDVFGHD